MAARPGSILITVTSSEVVVAAIPVLRPVRGFLVRLRSFLKVVIIVVPVGRLLVRQLLWPFLSWFLGHLFQLLLLRLLLW